MHKKTKKQNKTIQNIYHEHSTDLYSNSIKMKNVLCQYKNRIGYKNDKQNDPHKRIKGNLTSVPQLPFEVKFSL